jgi:hypothetical protein
MMKGVFMSDLLLKSRTLEERFEWQWINQPPSFPSTLPIKQDFSEESNAEHRPEQQKWQSFMDVETNGGSPASKQDSFSVISALYI